MKKFFICCLLFVMVAYTSLPVLGVTRNMSDESTDTLSLTTNEDRYARHETMIAEAQELGGSTNEYDAYLELKSCDSDELTDRGYTKEEIAAIHSSTLEGKMLAEVFRRATLDDETLTNMGYNTQEISQLRALTGDETLAEVAPFALASVTCYNTITSHTYSNSYDKTYLLADFGWEWDKMPVIKRTDTIGCGWSEDYYPDNSVGDNVVTNVYRQLNGAPNTKEVDTGLYEKQLETAEHQFEMQPTLAGIEYWCESGYGTMTLSQAGLDNNAKFSFKYAHDTMGITPSVSAPWGIGFSFDHAEDIFTPAAGVAYSDFADIIE